MKIQEYTIITTCAYLSLYRRDTMVRIRVYAIRARPQNRKMYIVSSLQPSWPAPGSAVSSVPASIYVCMCM